MPSINNIEVIDRNNRPQVETKVMLRTFFINDGVYTDPYAVSSVQIFKRASNLSPNSVLNSDGLVSSGAASTVTQMGFGVTGTGVVGVDESLLETKYLGKLMESTAEDAQPCSGVSGIYHLGTGEFACVLDGKLGAELSGMTAPICGPGVCDGSVGITVQNTADAAIQYIDVWTVKMTPGSTWNTYINTFELYDDTFFTITQPLMLRTSNKLFNKQVILGSKENIKIGTEVTIENAQIDESIKNIFRENVITSATVVIQKLNEDSYLPSRVTVASSTDQYVEITPDNTIIYSFDTNLALTEGQWDKASDKELNIDELGSKQGTYSIQVKYNLLAEKIVSPLMYFIVK